ncbi:hypothetical protein [Streptomyces sp. NPDC002215]|uniref:hypothetical protein n=1 Tax=Streptomyces sp. NPDC002215 TaxID=3154412 RepID=UPI00332BFEA7
MGERESEVDEIGETFGRRVAVGALRPAFQACFGAGEGVGERVGQQPVAAGEAVVHQGGGDAGVGRDVGYADAVEPVPGG